MYLTFIATAVVVGLALPLNSQYTEEDGKKYLETLNKKYAEVMHDTTVAEWNHDSNINDETLKKKLEATAAAAEFFKKEWEETVKYPWQTFQDPDVKRQFMKFSVLGESALPEEKFKQLDKTVTEMASIYSTAKICDFNNPKKCDLSLEPELVKILGESRNEAELKHVWVEWRKQSGSKIKKLFQEYVKLSNEAAVLNNFTDTAELWLRNYEMEEFRDEVDKLWDQLKPLYEEMHAYVRRKLREKYGEEVVPKKGPIPAHLLGNMWAQTWVNLLDITLPFPDVKAEDVSKHLKEQGYTPIKIFKLAEEFFTSVNLSAMPPKFWERSILEKPTGRELVCHASAWDFYDGKDFRIKQCTDVTYEHLETAHHEMGHIQYFLQYKHLPYIYRQGANPGFHEAIGDVIGLSVSTPRHLTRVGILPEGSGSDTFKEDLNSLFQIALNKISFLPFGYLMDLWRWNVFKGQITPQTYNCEWWKLRTKYQGVSPPVERTEDDFDPGAKYHIVASVPYIRYFVSFVIQFQFHQALCEAAGEYDPANPSAKYLHQCDIYKSEKAGNLLRKVLQLGSSKPWPDAMEVITGQRNMDAGPLLNYFDPIYQWLKMENEKAGEFVGWEAEEKGCSPKSMK